MKLSLTLTTRPVPDSVQNFRENESERKVILR